MLSASDLMIGLFCQNIQTTMFHRKSSLLIGKSLTISVFYLYLSMYSIAIIGIYRYVRIKYYASFKAFWTARVVLTLICIQVFLAFFQAAMIAISVFWKKKV